MTPAHRNCRLRVAMHSFLAAVSAALVSAAYALLLEPLRVVWSHRSGRNWPRKQPCTHLMPVWAGVLPWSVLSAISCTKHNVYNEFVHKDKKMARGLKARLREKRQQSLNETAAQPFTGRTCLWRLIRRRHVLLAYKQYCFDALRPEGSRKSVRAGNYWQMSTGHETAASPGTHAEFSRGTRSFGPGGVVSWS